MVANGWSSHLTSLGYLCLVLALLVHTSHQSFLLDLGYTDRRLLDRRDVTHVGYDHVTHRQVHDGSRLKRLLGLSRRLSRGSRAAGSARKTKVSRQMLQELNLGVRLLLDALSEPTTPAPLQQQQSGRNKSKRTDVIGEIQLKYSDFYNALTKFSNELPGKLQSGAPAGLSEADVLTVIMKPEDHVFSDANMALFRQKYFMIYAIVDKLLYLCRPYLVSQSEPWYWTEFMSIYTTGGAVRAILLTTDPDHMDGEVALPAGVGGVNSGVREDMSAADLDRLARLIDTLNDLQTQSGKK